MPTSKIIPSLLHYDSLIFSAWIHSSETPIKERGLFHLKRKSMTAAIAHDARRKREREREKKIEIAIMIIHSESYKNL